MLTVTSVEPGDRSKISGLTGWGALHKIFNITVRCDRHEAFDIEVQDDSGKKVVNAGEDYNLVAFQRRLTKELSVGDRLSLRELCLHQDITVLEGDMPTYWLKFDENSPFWVSSDGEGYTPHPA